MKIHTRTHTDHSIELDDGTEVGVNHQPADHVGEPLVTRIGHHLVVAYLSHDSDCENPFESQDGIGKIVGQGRYANNRHDESEMGEAMGLNRYGDPDYDKVEDQLQQAWCTYIEAQDGDFWSAVIDELGYPVPNRDNDDEMDAARDYINALRDELLSVDIASEGSPYYALCRAEGYLTEHSFSHDQASNAASLFKFDVEQVQHGLWLDALQRGDIGDKDRVILDVYDHSGLHWSISGGGMQCRWDTSSGAGVWLPDDSARDEIDRREQVYAHYLIRKAPVPLRGVEKAYQLLKVDWIDGKPSLSSMRFSDSWVSLWDQAATLAGPLNATPEQARWARRQAAAELAQNALDEYNAWLSGDCYGCVVETFTNVSPVEDEPVWERVEEDACWGFIGSDYAQEELRERFFDQAVADLQATALAE